MAKVPSVSHLPTSPAVKIRQLHFEHAWLQEYCPELYSILAIAMVDGQARAPATVTLFSRDGRLQYCIHDHESGQNGFGTIQSDGSPLQEISAKIGEQSIDWRRKKLGEKPPF